MRPLQRELGGLGVAHFLTLAGLPGQASTPVLHLVRKAAGRARSSSSMSSGEHTLGTELTLCPQSLGLLPIPDLAEGMLARGSLGL